MTHKKTTLALALVVLLQTGVLLGEYLGAVLPLWQGAELRLRTLPVDPRSLFRGNYARLRYEISELPASAFEAPADLRPGERVFVRLERDAQGLHRYAGVSLNKPKQGQFMRGRVDRSRSASDASIGVRYGIEAWFAPKEKALQLERTLGSGAVAVIKVSDSGRAALHGIESVP